MRSLFLIIVVAMVHATHDPCFPKLKTFTQYTQGGWGAPAAGNNPGVYRDANFAGAFPAGLTIGSIFTLTLTSSQAVEDFLPSGSTPSQLTQNYVDPGNTYNNVLAGQLVALTLNAVFDLYDPNFSPFTSHNLVEMIYNEQGSICYQKNVSDILQLANLAIGGSVTVDLSDLNDCLDAINNNYNNFSNKGLLISQQCDCIFIDFKHLPDGSVINVGDFVFEQWAAQGVHITSNDPGNHPPQIFDSSNPTGGDVDLGSPNQDFGGPGIGDGGRLGMPGENSLSQGYVLILSENNGLPPDDNANGGTFIFTFDWPVDIRSLGILDFDLDEVTGKLTAFDSIGGVVKHVGILALGDNSFQEVFLNVTGVTRLEIFFPSSGSVTQFVFNCTDDNFLGALGDFVWNDLNRNGIQDPGEQGIPGVVVDLFDPNQGIGPGFRLATDTTDSFGIFGFENLPAGNYVIRFHNPDNITWAYSPFQVGSPGNDSDATSNLAFADTQTISLSSGEIDLTWDLGLYQIGTPTITATITSSPTITATTTSTITSSPTITATTTATITSSPTITATTTSTITSSPTITATITSSPTISSTITATITSSPTITATTTTTITSSPTFTSTITSSSNPTSSITPSTQSRKFSTPTPTPSIPSFTPPNATQKCIDDVRLDNCTVKDSDWAIEMTQFGNGYQFIRDGLIIDYGNGTIEVIAEVFHRKKHNKQFGFFIQLQQVPQNSNLLPDRWLNESCYQGPDKVNPDNFLYYQVELGFALGKGRYRGFVLNITKRNDLLLSQLGKGANNYDASNGMVINFRYKIYKFGNSSSGKIDDTGTGRLAFRIKKECSNTTFGPSTDNRLDKKVILASTLGAASILALIFGSGTFALMAYRRRHYEKVLSSHESVDDDFTTTNDNPIFSPTEMQDMSDNPLHE